ncbi:putative RNA-directed DNA polymerase from transposon BS [Stylophora pistillata]|uniref:Putative RNA-directed DNA polymerase from transposon BS n=2 Tax=Stylophora pistillata TaxID=50429 RepID=A0A2B4RYT1_STYPI|nr:putative RNA-directed DNA polymerase from transposon BS [Stylophora pistillata]
MPANKSSGIDNIPVRVIKDSLPVILSVIISLINASFSDGKYPRSWKLAVVSPIPKEGSHEEPDSNRPISLLPIVSKVCERAALNQIMSFLVSNERLSTRQSGNKKLHSTETSLIRTTDAILSAIDDKKITAVVLLDMSKAFDTINHGILLNKLLDIGISLSSVAWFTSYLSDRRQEVRINSALSDPLPIVSGVPQGSVLGPILFNIYVNDLPLTPRSFLTESYVDDTKLYVSFPVQDWAKAVADLSADLLQIRNWCFANRLLLNPDKTKLTIYGSRQNLNNIPVIRLFISFPKGYREANYSRPRDSELSTWQAMSCNRYLSRILCTDVMNFPNNSIPQCLNRCEILLRRRLKKHELRVEDNLRRCNKFETGTESPSPSVDDEDNSVLQRISVDFMETSYIYPLGSSTNWYPKLPGVYSIYYVGKKPLYEGLVKPSIAEPIYVGMSKTSISVRLKDHLGKINRAKDLKVRDFIVRFMTVDNKHYAPCIEGMLIEHFNPIWNSETVGISFGNAGSRESDWNKYHIQKIPWTRRHMPNKLRWYFFRFPENFV